MFRRGNRCTQVFATHFGLSCLFPVKLKSKAHETLSLLFQWDGMPSVIICNNTKEMILGEFNSKIKDSLVKCSWKRELKRGSGRNCIKTGTLMKCWDDCLELESYIWSNTTTNWMRKYVQRSIWQKPVLLAWLVSIGAVLRQNGSVSRWPF